MAMAREFFRSMVLALGAKKPAAVVFHADARKRHQFLARSEFAAAKTARNEIHRHDGT